MGKKKRNETFRKTFKFSNYSSALVVPKKFLEALGITEEDFIKINLNTNRGYIRLVKASPEESKAVLAEKTKED